ncbi:hypothetical protein [Bdellovibrio bacteriovorus]|uniref:hypothetical protein n=1 Tax=Bdellovibrio TaxID=958 RepID=UPI0035A8B961
MKRFLLALLFLKSSFSLAAAPAFVELSSDKVFYQIGDQAVLMATVSTQPNNPAVEVYLEGKLDGNAIKLIKISDSISSAVTPIFNAEGNFEFEIKAYFQDKKFAKDTTIAMAGLQKEIIFLQEKLSTETNPTKRNLLQQAIDRDRADLISLENNLIVHRLLVETKAINLSVSSAQESRAPLHPALVITTDHADNTYSSGETAVLNAHVYTNLIGQLDGPQETIISATIDEEAIYEIFEETPDHYLIKTTFDEFNSVGDHEIVGTLWVRNKARSNKLRDAITKAEKRRAEQIVLKDNTEDPYLEAYYQMEIDDLSKIIDSYYLVLDGIKSRFAETRIILSVTQ